MLPTRSPDLGILKLSEKREKCCASEFDDSWLEVSSVRRLIRKRLISTEGYVLVSLGSLRTACTTIRTKAVRKSWTGFPVFYDIALIRVCIVLEKSPYVQCQELGDIHRKQRSVMERLDE